MGEAEEVTSSAILWRLLRCFYYKGQTMLYNTGFFSLWNPVIIFVWKCIKDICLKSLKMWCTKGKKEAFDYNLWSKKLIEYIKKD